jgi:AcrR family transcriptional regulator
MARPPATESQKDAVRSKIRQAAVNLYREQGITNITARAIAVRAGVSVGTIYKHFGNLSELARTLWQGPVERFEQSLEEQAARQSDPLLRLQELLEGYLDFAEQNAELYRGAFLFVRPPNEAKPDKEAITTSVFAKLLIEALEQGQREGAVLAGDAVEQAQLLWAGVHGAIALPTNLDRLQWQLTDMRGPLLDGLLRMVSISVR